MSKLRLLYSSNAFWAASGYGVQGRSLLPRLANLPEFGGREAISQFAWYGLQGGIHQVDGFTVYPSVGDAYGNDVIGAHTRNHRANIVITLIDVWVLRDTARAIKPALWLPWLPIDHDPVPQRFLDSLQGAYLPLTYAKWGHEMLKKAGVHNYYIPHGIETDIFKILPRDARLAQFKRELTGRDDAHLAVMVAANKGYPDRKAFQFQLRAWAEFAQDKPHAYLYLHTEPTPMHGGLDFGELTRALDIEKRVIFPERYANAMGYPAEYLSLIYNCADVYLGASMSEGFGIPLVEAQACGCPVIVNNFSAMPELVRWGQVVEPLEKYWTPMNSFQTIPNRLGILEALESLHAEWLDNERGAGDRWQAFRQIASRAMHDEYNWDVIVRDMWQPLMADLAEAAPPLQAPIQAPPPPKPEPNGLHKLGVTVEDRRMPVRRVAPLAKEEVAE